MKTTKTKLIASITAAVCIAAGAGLIIAKTAKNPPMVGGYTSSTNEKPPKPIPNVTDENGNDISGEKYYAMPAKMAFTAATYADESGNEVNSAVTANIIATITPNNAANKKVDWSAAFKNPESEWASGKTLSDYIGVMPAADGSLSATVTCKQPFTGEIVVVCVTRQGKYVATCTVTYAGQPTEITLAGSTQETDGAYRFGIGNTYEYAIEMSNPFGAVGEKFNDISVSVTGVGQVVLGYMEHFQAQNKDKWYDASDKTVEYDSLKDALISASYANGKLTIKTLSAVEDFYRGTGRMDGGRTIFYEGKFRSYVTDCYFNVTLTERNSGCSKTIKVVYDPGVVTGVNMSQNEMEF